jgi:site-specific recombinase XerD
MHHPLPLSYATRREVVERVVPLYQKASLAQKVHLLDQVVAVTGYARTYAIHLLNHAPPGQRTIQRRRPSRYPAHVQQALVELWKAAKYICAKRLIPFLPTLMATLQRQGHLHLSEECRRQLLAMSPSTAERLLRSQPKPAPRRRATTQAGHLLKSQIPIRTFQQWDDTRPGFLEADLVAHTGGQSQGCSLYTLTLTDVATGWTECLPLLYKNPEPVLLAFQQARALFPFPILGLDVDNGGEFLNELLMHYCEAEQITFTRGRECLKADQCFVEQKNGAIVRQMIGYDRLIGEQAYQQLRELYRAIRLYVNCFQPCMKLLSKHQEGGKIRKVYDEAKTPMQRLLLSGVLSTESLRQLDEVVQALDPLRLLQHLEHLQHALWHSCVTVASLTPHVPVSSILPFCVQDCMQAQSSSQQNVSPAPTALLQRQNILPESTDVLDWPRTSKDPFEGQWELIASLALVHPEWSGNELFQQMHHLFPGRYRPSQLTTLQRGLRIIRARLFTRMQEPWPQEVIQASTCIITSAKPDPPEQKEEPPVQVFHLPSVPLPVPSCSESEQAARLGQPSSTREEAMSLPEACPLPAVPSSGDPFPTEPDHPISLQDVSLPQATNENPLVVRHPALTIEQAIQSYLQAQRANERSPKTIEWHQTALGQFQQYLVGSRRISLVCLVTEEEVRKWIAFLRTTPSIHDTARSASTIATYARSARAFCHWLVRTGSLERTPFVRGSIPKAGKKTIHLIEPEAFERLLLACRLGEEGDWAGERAAARNRSILWVFLDTGMRVSELCGLRLGDVDREQRALRVQRTESNEQWVSLSPNGWFQLLSYLEQYRLKAVRGEHEGIEEDHLFLSEWYRPLTSNGITLLFDRLKKRAGMSEQPVSPSVLRDTFAVRFLQAAGESEALRAILGLRGKEALTRYEQLIAHKSKNDSQPLSAEESSSEPQPVLHRGSLSFEKDTGKRKRRKGRKNLPHGEDLS